MWGCSRGGACCRWHGPRFYLHQAAALRIVCAVPIPPENDSLARLEAAELLIQQTRLDLANGRVSADTARGRLWCVIESLAHVARNVYSPTS